MVTVVLDKPVAWLQLDWGALVSGSSDPPWWKLWRIWAPEGFPGSSDGKGSACNAGDLCSIPGLGRSPGEGKGYPLQYTHSTILAWRIPWTEESGRLQSMGLQRVGCKWVTHRHTDTHTHISSGKQGFRAVWSAALQKTLQGFLQGQPLWTSLPHLPLFFLLHLPSSWMRDFFLTLKDTSLSLSHSSSHWSEKGTGGMREAANPRWLSFIALSLGWHRTKRGSGSVAPSIPHCPARFSSRVEAPVMTHLPGTSRNTTARGLASGIAGSSSLDKGINNRKKTHCSLTSWKPFKTETQA